MPRYEFTEGNSSKFWEIELSDDSFTTTYGKIGTSGSSKTKSFADGDTAEKNYNKLIAQKVKKGYAAIGGKKSVAKNKAAPNKAVPKKAKVPAKASRAKSSTKKPEPRSRPATQSWMRYEFKDGSSKKFWEVTFDDSSFSTCYGRIGSNGTTTSKPAPDMRKAKALAEKAAATKVKGGYKLVGGEFPEIAPATVARNARLETMISKDPNNADTYLACADWLQERGDPRGELIVIQHALLAKPKDKKLQKAQAELHAITRSTSGGA